MQCTKCGTQNEDTARFCNSCGAALGVASAPPGRGASTATLVALVAVGLLVVLIVGVVTFMLVANAQKARMVAQIEALEQAGKQPPASPSPEVQPSSGPQTVPATDPVAEAQVVLEKYLAADLGHDGNEMKKYLGGQAAARFEPTVQGQEDLQVSSQQVAGHEQIDDTAIAFDVEVEWSAEGASGVQTQTDRYLLRRTEVGWKITSTPAYPE